MPTPEGQLAVRPPVANGTTLHPSRRGGLAVGLALVAVAWIAFAGWTDFNGAPHGGTWAAVWSTLRWLPTIVTHVPRNFGTFLVTTLLVAALGCPGAVVLRLARISIGDSIGRAAFAVATGLAGWVPLVLIVGTYAGLSRADVLVPTLIYIGLPAAYLAARWLRSHPGNPYRSWRTSGTHRVSWLTVGLVVLLVALLYLVLLGALQPEVQYDARWYHLGSAKHYVEVGRFYNIVAATHDPAMGLNPYQEIPYTGLYALSGPIAAKVLAFLDAPLICLAIISFARVHLRSTRVGLLAALGFMSIPIASWSSTTASNDLPVALYTLLSLHALTYWLKDTRQWRCAYLAVAMAAFSFGVKAFGLFTLVLTLALIAFGVYRDRRLNHEKLIRHLGAVVAAIVVVCLPWWIRAAAMTGDPVFPIASQIFHTEYWNSYAATGAAKFNRHVKLVGLPANLVSSLWTTVTKPLPFSSLVGPFFLAAIPLSILLAACTRQRPRRTVLLLGGYIVAWAAAWCLGNFASSRYLVSIAPLGCLAIGAVIADALKRPLATRALPVVVLVGLIALGISTAPGFVVLERGAVTPGVQGVIPYNWDYLYRGLPTAEIQLDYLPMVKFIDTHLSSHVKIYNDAWLDAVYEYVNPELYNGSNYGSPATMHQWSLASPSALQELDSNGISYLVAETTSVSMLSHYEVWHHLTRVYQSADGLVLFRIRP